jgi:hypothetical protein
VSHALQHYLHFAILEKPAGDLEVQNRLENQN